MANIMTMLNGQISANRVIEGVQADMSGKEGRYVLKSYEMDGKDLKSLSFVREDEVNKEDAAVVVITDKNYELAHYRFNPNPKSVPEDFNLDGDKFTWTLSDGSTRSTSLGFKPEEALGCFFGRAYFKEADQDIDYSKLVSYEIQSDTVNHTDFKIASGANFVNTSKDAFIVSNLIKTEQVGMKEGQPEVADVVKMNTIYAFNPNSDGLTAINFGNEIVTGISETENGNPVFVVEGYKDNRGQYQSYETPKVIVNDMTYGVEAEKVDSIKVSVGGQRGDVTIIASDSTFMVDQRNFSYKTMNKDIVDDLADFTTFCGKYEEFKQDGKPMLKLILSNDKDEVKRLVVDVTDRGQITTIDGKTYSSELPVRIDKECTYSGYDYDEEYDEEEEEEYDNY